MSAIAVGDDVVRDGSDGRDLLSSQLKSAHMPLISSGKRVGELDRTLHVEKKERERVIGVTERVLGILNEYRVLYRNFETGRRKER